MAMSTLRHAKKWQPNHSGTTEEGNGSYLLPLPHREIVFTIQAEWRIHVYVSIN